MTKQFAFEQPGGNGGTVEFYECPLLAPAVIVNGARNQLLSRTGIAQQQDGRIAQRDRFYQLQNVFQWGTRPNDLVKTHFAANLFFQIQLFLSQFVFKLRDLAVGERVFNRNGNLPRDYSEILSVIRAERVFLPPAKT